MSLCFGLVMVAILCPRAPARNNYEIQVYGSDIVEPGHTMVELHSNFTIDGSKTIVDGLYSTNHAEQETVEITHGFNDWFETGFYPVASSITGRVGPVTGFYAVGLEQHQVFPAIDLNLAPQGEVNFGPGWGSRARPTT
jgi:hypothetical protein